MSLFRLSLILIITFFSLQHCSRSSTSDDDTNNDLNYVSVKYLSGVASADLMPPVLPDPINIRIDIEFKNSSNSKTIKDFNFENERVFLNDNDSLIAEIDLYLSEEIILSPLEIDTVSFFKFPCDSMPFDVISTNRKYIYIDFDIVDKYGNKVKFKTDSIYFSFSAWKVVWWKLYFKINNRYYFVADRAWVPNPGMQRNANAFLLHASQVFKF